jgi:hypothetical protein
VEAANPVSVGSTHGYWRVTRAGHTAGNRCHEAKTTVKASFRFAGQFAGHDDSTDTWNELKNRTTKAFDDLEHATNQAVAE